MVNKKKDFIADFGSVKREAWSAEKLEEAHQIVAEIASKRTPLEKLRMKCFL